MTERARLVAPRAPPVMFIGAAAWEGAPLRRLQPRSSSPVSRPISTRSVLERDGAVRRDLRVYCPMEDATASLERCQSCPMCDGFDAVGDSAGRPAVRCSFDAPPLRPASRAVGSVVARFALAVRVDAVPLAVSSGAPASPLAVVDGDLRLVGLLDAGRKLRADERALSLAVEEHSTIPAALAQLARSRQRQLPVVARSGTFVGALEDLDAMRVLRGLGA